MEDAQARGLDIAALPADRILHNWHLLMELDGRIYPTLSGILFLARHPQEFLPHTYLSALSIPGKDISVDSIDQKHIEGRLVQILEDAMRFLYMHLRRPHRIQGLEPEVKPELPVEVLREALVNGRFQRNTHHLMGAFA